MLALVATSDVLEELFVSRWSRFLHLHPRGILILAAACKPRLTQRAAGMRTKTPGAMHSQLVESLKNLVWMNLALKCAVLLWKWTAETLAKPSKRCVSFCWLISNLAGPTCDVRDPQGKWASVFMLAETETCWDAAPGKMSR